MASKLTKQRQRRKDRVRAKLEGTGETPRISIFRSNRYIYAQAIDDQKRVTLMQSSSFNVRGKEKKMTGKRVDEAKEVGKDLGAKLVKKGIKKAVFDRSAFAYLGRVQAVADGLREAGLKI